MSLARVKTWVAGEILTASDLNAEFSNVLDNALSLISPLTGDLAFGGFRLTGLSLGSAASPALQFTGDSDTGIRSSAANTLDFTTGAGDRWRIDSAGHLLAVDTNTYDIGATGGTRPRNLFLAGTLTLGGGQIAFPAVQAPSADGNTLDDYEENTWTPVLTFATPGDLNVAYSTRNGKYRKIGDTVWLWFHIATSTFTFTTASGNCQITGLPFTPTATPAYAMGALFWQGITKASYTDISPAAIGSATRLELIACGSGQAASNVTAADMPTGGAVILIGTTAYTV